MTCTEEHKYAIVGKQIDTYDTVEEAEEAFNSLPAGAQWVAYHPGLIDIVIENPDTKTYCPEETQDREKAE